MNLRSTTPLLLCLVLAACSAPLAAPAATNAPTAIPAATETAPVAAAATLDAPAVTLVAPATATAEAIAATTTAPPAPTATAEPAVAYTQLTRGECCVQPLFSANGERVLFLDRPSAAQPPGIYGVAVAAPMSEPVLVTERLGPFNRDLSLNVNLINGRTVVEGPDGQQWPIDNGGRPVSFSPDGARISWSVSAESGGFDTRRSDVWLANIDGSQARRVATRFGGGAVAWLRDGQRMLLGGRANRGDAKSTLSILDLRDDSVRDLFSAERWRGIIVAPDDKHLVYFVAQAREDGKGGMYVMDLEAAGAEPQRLDFFGAYRWRDATRLFYIPLKADAPSNELWQYDVATGKSELLIAASDTSPFKIGNGDWDVSPDGTQIVFVNARDRNLWLVTLRGS